MARLERIVGSKDRLLALFFGVLCLVLWRMPTGYEAAGPSRLVRRARARVIAVDNRGVMQTGVVRTGGQRLEAELLGGPERGRCLAVENPLFGRLEIDEVYAVDDQLLVQYGLTADGSPEAGIARGHYRLHLELVLVGLFVGLLLLVAGVTGLKAVLSFGFALLMIWKVMIPLFLKGIDPIPVALAVVAALTASISFLVGGVGRKGLTAFAGAFLGLLLTAGLAQLFGRLFQVHGAARLYAEPLLYGGFYHLRLTPIFIACIFVSASGAVMDIAMDVAASMEEVKRRHPTIPWFEHVRSGLRVGRSVIGTMTTTLLLAYSGGSIFMFMLFVGQNVPAAQIFNLNHVAAEVLNTLVGSFGLVTVAPFTALVGGWVMRGGSDDPPRHAPASVCEHGTDEGEIVRGKRV